MYKSLCLNTNTLLSEVKAKMDLVDITPNSPPPPPLPTLNVALLKKGNTVFLLGIVGRGLKKNNNNNN